MKKELMEKIEKHNVVLKLLTFFFALLIWILIYNYNDPVITNTYSLKVNIENEELLEKASKVYGIIQGETVSVKIKGKKSFIDSLNKEDIIASADLSNLSEVNATSIKIDIPKASSSEWEVSSLYPELLKVEVDEYMSSQYPIEIKEKGKVPDDKYLKDFSAMPSSLNIDGARSFIERIDKVIVEPDISDANEGFSTYCSVKILDKDGKDITNETNLNVPSIRVSATVYTKKELPVNINVINNVPEGYEIVNYDYNPKTVTVAGYTDNLKTVDELSINYTLNQIDNIEKEINLEDYISNTMVLLSNSSLNFTAEISAFPVKDFEIDKDIVNIKNLDSALKIESISIKNPMLQIIGPVEEVEDIELNDLNVYIDLTDIKAGEIEVTPSIEIPNTQNTRVLTAPTVTLKIKKK